MDGWFCLMGRESTLYTHSSSRWCQSPGPALIAAHCCLQVAVAAPVKRFRILLNHATYKVHRPSYAGLVQWLFSQETQWHWGMFHNTVYFSAQITHHSSRLYHICTKYVRCYAVGVPRSLGDSAVLPYCYFAHLVRTSFSCHSESPQPNPDPCCAPLSHLTPNPTPTICLGSAGVFFKSYKSHLPLHRLFFTPQPTSKIEKLPTQPRVQDSLFFSPIPY